MNRKLIIVLLFIALSANGCAHQNCSSNIVPVEQIAIRVSVSSSDHGQPIATILAENQSPCVVGIVETLWEDQRWFYLEIEGIDSGNSIPHPVPSDLWERFDIPEPACVAPSETVELSIPLFEWFPIESGEEVSSLTDGIPLSYDLSPGRYRIRAAYRSEYFERSGSCAVSRLDARSDWIEFEIE